MERLFGSSSSHGTGNSFVARLYGQVKLDETLNNSFLHKSAFMYIEKSAFQHNTVTCSAKQTLFVQSEVHTAKSFS